MPPPPPPSKSYQLDLSAFSDSDSDDDDKINHRGGGYHVSKQPQWNDSSFSSPVSAGTRRIIETRSITTAATQKEKNHSTDNNNNSNVNHPRVDKNGTISVLSNGHNPMSTTVEVTDDDYDDDDDDDDDDEIVEINSDHHNENNLAVNDTSSNKKKKKKNNRGKKKKKNKKRSSRSSSGSASSSSPQHQQSLTTSALSPSSGISNISDDDEDDDDDDTCANGTHSKSNKLSSTSTQDKKTINKSNKSVGFSNVAIRCYPRTFGEDVVPNDGGWPLGMKLQPVPHITTTSGSSTSRSSHVRSPSSDHDNQTGDEVVTIDDYEDEKQQDLHHRWMSLQQQQQQQDTQDSTTKRKSVTSTTNSKEKNERVQTLMESSSKQRTYETRQWDYRSSVKNPIFGPIDEDERRQIFLSLDQEDVHCDLGGGEGKILEFSDECLKPLSSSSPPSSPTTTRRRTRSNSVSSTGSTGSCNSRHDRNKRHSNRTQEQFNETYNQFMVHHTRNELEKIRDERSKTGCTCRKLNVYLPPKNAPCGKKANHRRLKPGKLAQELKKRHLYDANMSREDMEKLLHDTVEKEPCCGLDCFCVRNGIECSMDSCSCWKAIRPKSKDDPFPTSTDIKKFCRGESNMDGMYVVSLGAIDGYRENVLNKVKTLRNGDLFCGPVNDD